MLGELIDLLSCGYFETIERCILYPVDPFLFVAITG
jgi:hypothetical protein